MNLNCELNGNFIKKKNAHRGIYSTERAPELEMVNEQQLSRCRMEWLSRCRIKKKMSVSLQLEPNL